MHVKPDKPKPPSCAFSCNLLSFLFYWLSEPSCFFLDRTKLICTGCGLCGYKFTFLDQNKVRSSQLKVRKYSRMWLCIACRVSSRVIIESTLWKTSPVVLVFNPSFPAAAITNRSWLHDFHVPRHDGIHTHQKSYEYVVLGLHLVYTIPFDRSTFKKLSFLQATKFTKVWMIRVRLMSIDNFFVFVNKPKTILSYKRPWPISLIASRKEMMTHAPIINRSIGFSLIHRLSGRLFYLQWQLNM